MLSNAESMMQQITDGGCATIKLSIHGYIYWYDAAKKCALYEQICQGRYHYCHKDN